MAAPNEPTNVSFAADIAPLFGQYSERMRWRMNLTDYDDVKANATLIYSLISAEDDSRMPPPMYEALSKTQIANFKWWKDNGFPP